MTKNTLYQIVHKNLLIYSLLLMSISPSLCHADDIFKSLVFSKNSIPKSIKYQGEITAGLKWIDRTGENYVIFSEDRTKHGNWFLYVNYYRLTDTLTTQVRRLRDKERCGDLDNVSFLDMQSIGLTDLDDDHIGEVSFVYSMGCGDGLGNVAKLMILEDKSKYAIRGSMSIDDRRMNYKTKGKMDIGSALKKLKDPFLSYAIDLWKKHTQLVFEHNEQ